MPEQMTDKMRKSPRQPRARATVDFILDAAAYILEERGFEGFTTNHIAERAGVNISSLYQYFPDKLAILEALQGRHIATADVGYEEGIARLRDQPLEEVVRTVSDRALEMHASNSAMQKLFLDTLPRRTRREHESFEADRLAKLAAILLPKSRASRHPDMMMFIARHAFTSVVHAAVCDRPKWLTDPAFRDELVALLTRFLAPDRRDESGAPGPES
jgi:AcrR family transcriptional regulator